MAHLVDQRKRELENTDGWTETMENLGWFGH